MSEQRPEFLSLQNAAVYSDTSVDFIRDMIADGTLPASRLARKGTRGLIRVKVTDLDAAFRPVRAGDSR